MTNSAQVTVNRGLRYLSFLDSKILTAHRFYWIDISFELFVTVDETHLQLGLTADLLNMDGLVGRTLRSPLSSCSSAFSLSLTFFYCP
jgi:hypothetical protein